LNLQVQSSKQIPRGKLQNGRRGSDLELGFWRLELLLSFELGGSAKPNFRNEPKEKRG